ncbi:Bug family tripartite tricarboxylate transporter substrate binding protein [Pseudorhodoplanes sp.]|uniref:Bug family tripartite tricarboxylate transporter substrate binding protein n=1 Tax=Pseudorhodoplanes sp. TaxID=1934341 RepID=UPI003D15277C
MKMRVFALACVSILAVAPAAAQQQPWPSKPIQMVVSFGAGGTADIIARMIAEELSPVLGQPVVIENRPGAGGNLGASVVARSPADGYTLLMSGSPTHSVGPHLFKNLSYDPMRDVPPVAMIAIAPNLLVVNPKLPVNSVKELVQYAREKPGQLTFSSAGPGTSGYLAAALLKDNAKLDMAHIPYKSGPEAVTGVLSGDVGFIFFTLPALLPQVESGKLRALAITGRERSQLVPKVPTVAESGFSDYEVLAWFALFAPRGTPEPVVQRLASEIEKILKRPDIREKMAKLGAEPRFMNPKQLTDFVAVESPKWGRLLKDSKAEK